MAEEKFELDSTIVGKYNSVLNEYIKTIYLLNMIAKTRKLPYKITVSNVACIGDSKKLQLTFLMMRRSRVVMCDKIVFINSNKTLLEAQNAYKQLKSILDCQEQVSKAENTLLKNLEKRVKTIKARIKDQNKKALAKAFKFVFTKSICGKDTKLLKWAELGDFDVKTLNEKLITYIIRKGVVIDGYSFMNLPEHSSCFELLGKIKVIDSDINKPVSSLFTKKHISSSVTAARLKTINPETLDDPEYKTILKSITPKLPQEYLGKTLAAVCKDYFEDVNVDMHLLPSNGREYDATKYRVFDAKSAANSSKYSLDDLKKYFREIQYGINETFADRDNALIESLPDGYTNDYKKAMRTYTYKEQ